MMVAKKTFSEGLTRIHPAGIRRLQTFVAPEPDCFTPAGGFGVQRSNQASGLFRAVVTHRLSKIKFLLDNGVSTTVLNDRGHNLLITSLFINDGPQRDRVFRYLLQRGVDCCYRQQETGRDVLAWACLLGRADQVRRTLEAAMGEIDLLKSDNDGQTPLHLAVQKNYMDVVHVLVKVLQKYHLSVDISDKYGLTPYMYARRLGLTDMALYLQEQGHASVHQRDSVTFKSAEDWAGIGAKEQEKKRKYQVKETMAFYKIRGRLPPISELPKHLPQVMVNGRSIDHVATSPRPSMCSHSDQTLNSNRTSSSDNDDEPQQKISPDRTNRLTPPGQVTHGGLFTKAPHPALQRSLRRGSQAYLSPQMKPLHVSKREVMSKSVDTAFTLLGLQAVGEGELATHFVSSQPVMSEMSVPHRNPIHLTKSAGTTIDLSAMLTALSDQQSSSFRKVAIVPKSPIPTQRIPTPKSRKKVSSLALLLAKERRSGAPKGRRVKSVSNTRRKSNSSQTMKNHAKLRKKRQV